MTKATTAKQPFPSSRQSSCPGLRRHLYPAYVRDMVDVDYADRLPEAERIWLAAFLEEHYKGYRLAGETQVLPLNMLRASDAARKRVLRAEDVLAFDQHRAGSVDEVDSQGAHESQELAMLAGSQGRDAHELRGRNHTEDQLIAALDARA